MEVRISGVEHMIEELNISVKEKVVSIKLSYKKHPGSRTP